MPTDRSVSVVISRFEDLVARGLEALISADPNMRVAALDVAPGSLSRTLAAHEPQVAILNFGSLRSPAEVRELHHAHPQTRLIVLANRPSPVESNQMLGFGATACLSKETQARDVLSAIHLASRGLHVLPKTSLGFAPPPLTRPELLTPRESDVLELLQQGQSNAQIGAALHVGVETVRTHARNIYRKLGVNTRRELATLGVIKPAPRGGAPDGRPPAG